MLLGIDHLVIAVADPDEAAVRLEQELGLAATDGGVHPALGTRNRLAWLGSSYIELLGIVDPDVAGCAWIGAPVLGALAGGGGLATWAVATDGLDAELAALRARRFDPGEPVAGERRRPDGDLVRWRIAVPRRLGPGEPPFLIEHDTSAAEWRPSDRAARAGQAHPLGGRVRLAVLELAVDDVQRTSLRFTRALGLRFRPSLAGAGSRDAAIGGQTVRLRPRRGGPASTVIRLTAPVPEPRDVQLLGCRWVLRPEAGPARPSEPAKEERT
jgi:catechol 2,3-dioxygenase-like lactoylglutathione lyase family enzyme